jgi:GDP-4-dehydro-6-deoxy-D-mannose reductase
MKALITGSEGFVAQHLKRHLESLEYEVFGLDIKTGVDIRDYEAVHTAIDIVRPDLIFHLAALAYVPESFLDPRRAIEINAIGSLNILEAVRHIGLKTRIQMAGTSEEYGDTSSAKEPITEESLPNPLSPYAISKLTMDHLGRLYAKAYNMNVVITRAYNHAGPGRGEEFAESAFSKQIALIENKEQTVLKHGNLESIRNYTDVRDIVRAYELAIKLPSGVYNICSDQNVTMQEMMDILTKLAKVPIITEVDKNLYRPADFSFKKPSCEKFKKLTGWEPKIPLEHTLNDILNDWRMRVL